MYIDIRTQIIFAWPFRWHHTNDVVSAASREATFDHISVAGGYAVGPADMVDPVPTVAGTGVGDTDIRSSITVVSEQSTYRTDDTPGSSGTGHARPSSPVGVRSLEVTTNDAH